MEAFADNEGVFLAYVGRNGFSKEDLFCEIDDYSNRGHQVKFYNHGIINFYKMVPRDEDSYTYDLSDYEPINESDIFVVSSYNEDKLLDYIIKNYEEYASIPSLRIIPYLYREKGISFLEELAKHLDYSIVLYDQKNKQFLGFQSKHSNGYNQLYFGYTKNSNELMYSNKEELLRHFCTNIHKMEKNTYYDGETIHMFSEKEEKKDKEEDLELIKNNKENAESLLGGLNALLASITNNAVKAKIEKNVDEYLSSGEPKERIIDYITKELDSETQKEVLKTVKKYIKEKNIDNILNNEFDKTFNEKLEEYTNKIEVPVIHVIKYGDIVLGKTKGEFFHEKFKEILDEVEIDEPVMLIGPAGSGKNVVVKQVADALGKKMYYTNNASNEFKITGFIDAGGTYRDTQFYKAFKDGGLFFLDEIDDSDPSALIVLNSALANGYMAFPHETIDKHKDFRIVAAANTWGKGSDLEYVGRNALDAATLDRFDNIYFDYDRTLEKNLFPNEEILEFMWSFRDGVRKSKVPHVVSTRGIGKVYKKELNGFPVEQILRANVVKNLGQDDVNTIIGNMENVDNSNKYYEGLKRLELRR